jgi:hypothetical protein
MRELNVKTLHDHIGKYGIGIVPLNLLDETVKVTNDLHNLFNDLKSLVHEELGLIIFYRKSIINLEDYRRKLKEYGYKKEISDEKLLGIIYDTKKATNENNLSEDEIIQDFCQSFIR